MNNEMRYCTLFRKYYLNKNYLVEDIKGDFSKFIFILESPHNDEIKKRYPVAGDSGKDMAKFLGLEENTILGKYATNNRDKGITILNISRVPLQITTDLEDDYIDLVEKLDSTIRKGYDYFGNHSNEEMNKIEIFLKKDFKKRLENIEILEDTKIIVCGRFAQTYVSKVIKEISIIDESNILYVPHPSRNQWIRALNDLNKIKDCLNEKI